MIIDDKLRATILAEDELTQLSWLFTISSYIEALDCGDSGCRSAIRAHGGMRTNGGCRCDPIQVAATHVSVALRIMRSPSAERRPK